MYYFLVRWYQQIRGAGLTSPKNPELELQVGCRLTSLSCDQPSPRTLPQQAPRAISSLHALNGSDLSRQTKDFFAENHRLHWFFNPYPRNQRHCVRATGSRRFSQDNAEHCRLVSVVEVRLLLVPFSSAPCQARVSPVLRLQINVKSAKTCH